MLIREEQAIEDFEQQDEGIIHIVDHEQPSESNNRPGMRHNNTQQPRRCRHGKQRHSGEFDTDSTSTSTSTSSSSSTGSFVADNVHVEPQHLTKLEREGRPSENENQIEDSSDVCFDDNNNKRTLKIHLWPYGRLNTCLALTLAVAAFWLSMLARRSTSFATLESGNGYGLISKEDMYLPLTKVGLFRIKVCELDLNDDQTLSRGKTPYRIVQPLLFELDNDSFVGPCHTKELLHAEINDSLWDASRVVSTCGLLLGALTLMLLSATICLPPRANPNLRAMTLLALGAYFCQTLTFCIFGSDMCYELDCSMSVGASYAVASSIMWFLSVIAIFNMYLRQKHADDDEEEEDADDQADGIEKDGVYESDQNDKEHEHGPQYSDVDGWVIPPLSLDDNDTLSMSMSTSTMDAHQGHFDPDNDDDDDDGCYNGACSPRSVAVAAAADTKHLWGHNLVSLYHCAPTLCLELGQEHDQDQDRQHQHPQSGTRTNLFEACEGTGLYEC
jgi:hypothetical protein